MLRQLWRQNVHRLRRQHALPELLHAQLLALRRRRSLEILRLLPCRSVRQMLSGLRLRAGDSLRWQTLRRKMPRVRCADLRAMPHRVRDLRHRVVYQKQLRAVCRHCAVHYMRAQLLPQLRRATWQTAVLQRIQVRFRRQLDFGNREVRG